MGEEYGFDTIKVRGSYDPLDHNYAAQVPIYETVSFAAGTPERLENLFYYRDDGYLYSRISNPTVEVLEKRLAQLEGAKAAVAVASGMAAVTYSILAAVECGGRVVTSKQIYGGSYDSFNSLLRRFGISFDVVDEIADVASFEKAITDETRAVFIESISNPLAIPADIEGIADVAHRHGIPLIVDNTVASPYLLNPIRYGADIVVYSTTKSISGHGTAIGGLIADSGRFNWKGGKFPQFEEPNYNLKDAPDKPRSFVEAYPDAPFAAKIRKHYLGYLGAVLSPFDAYLILIGLETLSERVEKQVRNTEKLVEYLVGESHVSWVSYPTLDNNPGRKIADKYLKKGAGSMFSFAIKGGEQLMYKFLNSLKLFGYLANIGDARTLIVNSTKFTHGEMRPDEQRDAGIEEGTLRVSVGIEDPEDLIADLKQGFKALDE